jgi:hypothetical protein
MVSKGAPIRPELPADYYSQEPEEAEIKERLLLVTRSELGLIWETAKCVAGEPGSWINERQVDCTPRTRAGVD